MTSNIVATLTANASQVGGGNLTRRRTKVFDQDQTGSLSSHGLRDYVKTHTPDDITVKKQKIISISSGQVTVTTDANESFLQSF